jgi:hypothetical protein
MTPKMAGALEALKKLRSAADDEADRLTKRIANETMPALMKAVDGAHGSVDKLHNVVDDIEEFTHELTKTNGGDPLDDSAEQSNVTELPPRSSEVASR